MFLRGLGGLGDGGSIVLVVRTEIEHRFSHGRLCYALPHQTPHCPLSGLESNAWCSLLCGALKQFLFVSFPRTTIDGEDSEIQAADSRLEPAARIASLWKEKNHPQEGPAL